MYRFLLTTCLLTMISLPGRVFAQELDCIPLTKHTGGIFGAPIQTDLTLSAEQLKSGFKVVSGSCEFTEGNGFGFFVFSRPIENGHSCRVFARNEHEAVGVTTHLTACRIMRPQGAERQQFKAPFTNAGLGGDTVAIARNRKGVIPYSVRVCNFTMGLPIDVDVDSDRSVRVDVRRCLEVDKPKWAMFRTPTTVSAVANGMYSLFSAGTFGSRPRVGKASQVPESRRVVSSQFSTANSLECRQPLAGEQFARGDYWGYCALDQLHNGKNYRVCFDNGYSNQSEGMEYAGGLLRLVLSHSLMERSAGGVIDSRNYLSIAPGGCFDLFEVDYAAILVVDNSWNDQSVAKVTYRFAELPAVH